MSCTPVNVYGPYEQTLFLGCSVQSFTATLGWNEQPSQLNVTIVEDDCAGSKVWYQPLTPGNLKRTYTAADPGFFSFGDGNDPPPVGAPVYFRVGDFEYSGLIQDWVEIKDNSEGRKFTVSISDPRTVIEGAKAIINDYVGSVGGLYNVFNAYGYAASVATPGCPIATVSPNGMSWNTLKVAIGALTSSVGGIITNIYSPYGRLVFKGSNVSSGNSKYGLLPYDNLRPNFTSIYGTAFYTGTNNYLLDLSEIPTMPADYRIPGNSINILDVISQVCHDAGYDYYIEMILVSIGTIEKFIKIRTVNRNVQPNLNAISNFIDNNSDTVLRTTEGRELRNEVTNTLVIGGNQKIIDELEGGGRGSSVIFPYWGLDENYQVITTSYYDTNYWQFTANTDVIEQMLITLTISESAVRITEDEIIEALAGFQQWLGHSIKFNTEIYQAVKLAAVTAAEKAAAFGKAEERIDALWGANEGMLRDVFKIAPNRARHVMNDLRKIYQWVLHFAQDFYGKKFIAKVANICMVTDSEGKSRTNREVTDAGYPTVDQLLTTIILLDTDGSAILFFEQEDGRIVHFVRYNDISNLDPDRIPSDTYIKVGTYLYVKVDVEKDLVFDASSNAYVVMTVPGFIADHNLNTIDNIHKHHRGFLFNAGAKDAEAKTAIEKSIVPKTLPWGAEIYAAMPNAAAVAFLDNQNTYGPWSTDNYLGGASGPPGQSEVEKDDGLVPWEFGGYTAMNAAANAIADSRTSRMQMGETGELIVPGYPEIPLGAELGAVFNITSDVGGGGGDSSNPVYNNRHLYESRDYSEDSSDSSTYAGYAAGIIQLGSWQGAYGPNITNINVSIGTQGCTTAYQMRTFTPSFGRLSKLYIERIRAQGHQQRMISKQQRFREFFANYGYKLGAPDWVKDVHAINDGFGEFGTPSEVIAGRTIDSWDLGNSKDGSRTEVAALSLFDTFALMDSDEDRFDNTAVSSYDMFFRPVSLSGDGSLSPFYTSNYDTIDNVDVGQLYNSRGAQPPFCKSTEDPDPAVNGFTQYDLLMQDHFFNPLKNPAGLAGPGTTNVRWNDTKGHDMEIVGRLTTSDYGDDHSSLVMHASDGTNFDNHKSDYTSDYRFLAMRGPMVLQSWGYDLDGKPVPNAADNANETNLEDGTMTHTGLKDTFFTDFLHKPKTWPVGPIDLRWDRSRGCWVNPPEYRLVVAKLNQDLSTSAPADAFILEGQSLWDENGAAITYGGNYSNSPRIQIYNKIGGTIPQDSIVVAYFDPREGYYYVVESPTATSPQLIKFELTADLSFEGEATAREVHCDSDTWVYADDGSSPFTVVAGQTSTKLPVEYMWGPARTGWHGWCMLDTDQGTCTKREIVYMERFAEFIEFKDVHRPTEQIETEGDYYYIDIGQNEINRYWFGNDPIVDGDSVIRLILPRWMNTACLPLYLNGVAVFEAPLSIPSTPRYRIISSDADLLQVRQKGCFTNGAFQNVQRLIAGTGVLFEMHSCTGQLALDLHFKSTDYDMLQDYSDEITDWSTLPFERIEFARGLMAIEKDSEDCTMKVGLAMDVEDTDTCCCGSAETTITANELKFGEGLKVLGEGSDLNYGVATIVLGVDGYNESNQEVVTDASIFKAGDGITLVEENVNRPGKGTCPALKIVNAGQIEVTDTDCNDARNINNYDPVYSFQFSKGINVAREQYVNADAIQVWDGIVTLDLEWGNDDTDACTSSWTEVPALSPKVLEDIRAGEGLILMGKDADDCFGSIALNVNITKTEDCFPNGIGVEDTDFNASSLVFGEGLKTRYDNATCQGGVYLAIDMQDGAHGGSANTSKIEPGCGIAFEDGSDSCAAKIRTDLKFAELDGTSICQPVSEIRLDKGDGCHQFDIEAADCSESYDEDCAYMKIQLNKSPGNVYASKNVNVLDNVWCDDNGDVYGDGKTIRFDECGHMVDAIDWAGP